MSIETFYRKGLTALRPLATASIRSPVGSSASVVAAAGLLVMWVTVVEMAEIHAA